MTASKATCPDGSPSVRRLPEIRFQDKSVIDVFEDFEKKIYITEDEFRVD